MFSTDTLLQVIVAAPPAARSSSNPPQTVSTASLVAVIRTPFVGSATSSTVTEPLTIVPLVGFAFPCTGLENDPAGVPAGCSESAMPSPFPSLPASGCSTGPLALVHEDVFASFASPAT